MTRPCSSSSGVSRLADRMSPARLRGSKGCGSLYVVFASYPSEPRGS